MPPVENHWFREKSQRQRPLGGRLGDLSCASWNMGGVSLPRFSIQIVSITTKMELLLLRTHLSEFKDRIKVPHVCRFFMVGSPLEIIRASLLIFPGDETGVQRLGRASPKVRGLMRGKARLGSIVLPPQAWLLLDKTAGSLLGNNLHGRFLFPCDASLLLLAQ